MSPEKRFFQKWWHEASPIVNHILSCALLLGSLFGMSVSFHYLKTAFPGAKAYWEMIEALDHYTMLAVMAIFSISSVILVSIRSVRLVQSEIGHKAVRLDQVRERDPA